MEILQKKCFYGAAGLAVVFLTLILAISFSAPYVVNDSCVIEAGKELTVDKLVSNPILRFFSSVCVQPKIHETGEQIVVVRVGAQKVRTNVIVKDRQAPNVTLREVSVLQGNSCKIDSFIVNIEDATKTTTEYVKEPDFQTEGIQKIKIKVTDSSGNETVKETQLIVVGK